MSQAGIINVIETNPSIPIFFDGNTGSATALVNVLNIIGVGDISVAASGNTLTISFSGVGFVTSVSGTPNRITSTGGATPVIDIAATYVGQTSITTLGTIATGVWQGTAVGAIYGGTAQTTYTTGDILYASAANTLSKLSAGSNTQVLTLAAGVPTWAGTAVSTLTTTYLVDGAWTIDPRAKLVRILAWGGGGGGGSGRCGASGSAGGGSGGACGGFVDYLFQASTLSASPYTITIGTGGAGGIAINAVTTNGNPGTPGNPTTVGSVILAGGGLAGGGGGTGGSSGGAASVCTLNGFSINLPVGSPGSNGVALTGVVTVNAISAVGGGASGYLATTPRIGGAGANNVDQAGNILVAGGLAGANTGATAGDGNAPSGKSIYIGATGGGGGGHNGTVTAGTGGNGAQPGAGGGGGAGNLSLNPSGTGGVGGNGKVVIIEYF